jgi:hypothetical protein
MSRIVIAILIYYRHKPIDPSLIKFYEYFTSEIKLITDLLSSLLFSLKCIHGFMPHGRRVGKPSLLHSRSTRFIYRLCVRLS